jgi:hypothetical protein
MKWTRSASMLLSLTVAACGGLANDPNPRLGISHAAKGAPGGGGGGVGGGGGGTQVPPPPTIDGPSQYLYDASGVGAPSPDIDFGAIANTAPGGIPVGNSRNAREFVFNTSKKTPLMISSISIVGANPDDFSVVNATAVPMVGTAIPPNQNAFSAASVIFTPTAPGTRTATLQIVSNAGVATANLTGVGISLDPGLPGFAPLTFLPDSAPDTLNVVNTGGSPLILQSLAIAGANPEAFTFTVANAGQSNCFDGIALAPQALCLLGVGVAPGAVPPASATLVILSNDPASPETDVSLTLLPAPTPTP